MYSIEAGDAEAFAQLAYAYQTGLGIKRNLKAAVKWYYRAAQEGSSHAILALAVIHDPRAASGLPNQTAADYYYTAAFAAFRHDEAHGDIDACYWLGILHLQQNPEGRLALIDAAEWLQKAADRGHPRAKTALKAVEEKAGDWPLPPRRRYM